HAANQSTLLLDIGTDSVQAELQIPVDELFLALPDELKAQSLDTLVRQKAELSSYIYTHLSATSSENNGKFAIKVRSLSVGLINQVSNLIVTMSLTPPQGASPRAFRLTDNVVLHRVVNHKTTVTIRRDFANAQFAEAPQLLGMIYYQNDTIVINQTKGSLWLGARAMIRMGMEHIADGLDHMLFMISLLIIAPMIRTRNPAGKLVWYPSSSVKENCLNIIKVVSAFTLGHSMTLLISALKLISIPSQAIEVMVAVTILLAAVHAIRPLFEGRDWLMAGAFGCIHGMAFASALENIGFDLKTFVVALFSFNLGIELAQLLIVAVLVPWLLLLARFSKYYDGLRVLIASFTALAALSWILERALGFRNWVNPLVEQLFSFSPYILLSFALLAILSVLQFKRNHRTQPCAKLM
ncbi:MAG: HupE/UreJ family protein, partial [Moraxellaceae bacterium]